MLINREGRSIYKIPILRNSNLAIFATNKISFLVDLIKGKFFKGKQESVDPSDSHLYQIQYEDCIFGGNGCHRRIKHLFDDLISVFQSGNKLVQGTDNQKTKFAVMLIPVDFQIYQDAVDKYGKLLSGGILFAYKNDDPNPQKKVKEMLDQDQIKYIDLLPAFRQNSEPRKFYVHDGHWNQLGHELAAEEIYKWMEGNRASLYKTPL